MWDGGKLEKTLRPWLKKVKVRYEEAQLCVPPSIIGKRLNEAIGGKAAFMIERLSPEGLLAEYGYHRIMIMVEGGYRYLVETKFEKVFDQAITEYFNKNTAAFDVLRSRSVDLTVGRAVQHFMGDVLLKQAFLTEEQRQNIMLTTHGGIEANKVQKA